MDDVEVHEGQGISIVAKATGEKHMNRFIKSAVAAAAALVAVQTASSAIITLFNDGFNRTGGLNGSAVDYKDATMYPGALTWVSSTNNTTQEANDGMTGGWNARLAFTPVAGEIYLLTLTAGTTINNALELGFGIHSSSSFGTFDGLIQNVSNMQTARIGSDATYNTYGPTVSGTRSHTQYTLDSGTGPGFVNTLTMLLDATSGLSTAQMTWSINGVEKGTWVANVTGYNAVLFGRGRFGGEGGSDPSGNATVRDITLQVIPEPATFGMLGAAAMAMLLRRRFAK
jgi:hypothetical protein